MGHMAGAISTFHGHEGLRQWARELGDMFAEFYGAIDEARIADDGRLLLRGHAEGRFARTGMYVDLPIWQEADFRGRRILRISQTEMAPVGWESAEAIGLQEE
jgi:hypothetical protein